MALASRHATLPVWIVLIALLGACVTVPAPPHPVSSAPVERTHGIFVTSNGWHSGIVLRRTDLPADRIPEAGDFPDARYLEFGWGDAAYYPAERATLGMTLRAAMTPTPAVVHLAALNVTPAERYPTAEVVSLSLDAAGLARLIEYIHGAFERGGGPRAASSGPGLYARSRFYPATGRFHLFNTCNTWTARALVAAGFALDPTGTAGADDLMGQVRKLTGAGRVQRGKG